MVKRFRKVKIDNTVYIVKALKSNYWRPGSDYLSDIISALSNFGVKDDDIIFISEKAVSTALGNIVDEDKVRPGILAKVIARFWMRYIWGYILGPLSRLRKSTILFLREYPLDYGARHKEVALRYAGLLSALCFGSEGGIDGSNLPYALVCLPLRKPREIAIMIRSKIEEKLRVKVGVILVDSDRCYKWLRTWVSPRYTCLKGVKSFGGVLTYVISNMLKLRDSPTPIAVDGIDFNLNKMYKLLRVVDKVRGHGAGRNVWEMAERFGTSLTGVTWNMLEGIPHYPIVIARKINE